MVSELKLIEFCYKFDQKTLQYGSPELISLPKIMIDQKDTDVFNTILNTKRFAF